MSQRNLVFDVLKGMGILLMLVGHLRIPVVLKTFIFSFHMPLFFILAGYFIGISKKEINCTELIEKNAIRLLLPFVFTVVLIEVCKTLRFLFTNEMDCLPRFHMAMMCLSEFPTRFFTMEIGPLWFLPALFFGKTIFTWLSGKIKGLFLVVTSAAISILTVFCYKWFFYPWFTSFFQGLSSLIFIAFGWLVGKHTLPKWLSVVIVCFWPLAVAFGGIEMISFSYKRYALDVLGACGGTICTYHVAKMLSRCKFIARPLAWCGRFSLAILCFHTFEWYSGVSVSIVSLLPFAVKGYKLALFRYSLTIGMSYMAVKLPGIREIFGSSRTRELLHSKD